MFYVVCNIRGSQITARRVTDGRTVCRDASRFKLANAVINTIDEPENSVEVQTPQAVPDLQIPEKGTPPSVPPVPPAPPDTVANAEKPQEPPSVEIIPEQETEPRTSTKGTVQPTGEQTSSDKTQKGKASAFISEGLYVSLTVDLVSLLD